MTRSTYNYRGKVEVFISIINSKGEKRIIKLPDFPVRVGRSSENHIIIPDDLCSSRHLLISKTQDEILIKDLNSKNGVALNGIKVFNQKIYIDDKITIGTTTIQIEKTKSCELALKKLAPQNNNRQNGEITIELEISKRNTTAQSKKMDLKSFFVDDEDDEGSSSESKMKKIFGLFKKSKKN